MNTKKSYLTITDQFCGAGGSSIGATAAGAELGVALNHWQLAIDTHNTNFPNAMHDCTDISACNPRRYPSTDILITSPECTNHSLAKGRPRPAQPDLFGSNEPDPAEERSRATMWDVPRFAEFHRYNVIIVENVVDARHWVTWDAWLHAMQLLGYEHQIVYFNSMFARPTPQSRDRMYVVFWRKGNRRPDLEFRPAAWCAKCAKEIEARQSWKTGGRQWGRYADQYVYRCPTCATTVAPWHQTAGNIIDWALPCLVIKERAKPLSERTLERIRAGLRKFGAQPLLTAHYSPGWTRPLTGPTGTITTTDHHGLIVPYYSNGNATPTNEPVSTVTTVDRHALVIPPFIVGYYTRPAGIGAAISGLDDPLPTQTTQLRHYLVQPGNEIDVEDCGFRMLQPHEIQKAMAFPDTYVILGNKRERVRQLGNAVTPPVMRLIVERIVKTF